MASNTKSQNALHNTLALMEAYEMFNHLTPGEMDTIRFALEQCIRAGYEEAARIITHAPLDLNVADIEPIVNRVRERRKAINSSTIYL